MYYRKDERLEKLLENKSVCLVGPAPYLMNKNIGNIIDQYDIICRMNEIFPVDLHKDYGSRTDISFLNCATLSVTDYVYKMREAGDIAENMKFIICPVIKVAHDWSGRVVDNAKMINIFDIPFYNIDEESYKSFYQEVGCEPNTGILAILILLQYNIKKLFITGMTFYSECKNGNPYDTHYHKNHTPEDLQLKTFNPHAGHSQLIQKEYFKSKILKDKRIMLDMDISKVLYG